MAPFTCKIVDSFRRGLSGVHATLECKDEQLRSVAVFETFSDNDGDMRFWFQPHFDAGAKPLQPKTVDIGCTPYVSVTLSLNTLSPNLTEPWISIRSDLYLSSEYGHGLVVHLLQHAASYRLEHTRYPATLVQKEMEWECPSPTYELMEYQKMASRSPSPLRLPSPVLPVNRDGILFTDG